MSLLAPLYFAGALAIGLPILFHLIRRRPKGELSFSSLMFLQPSPPRMTRRSRLHQWPLLLIRALALILLAAAFSRPFWRIADRLDAEVDGRRIVMAIDTSASMRRGDLWNQAIRRAENVLNELSPGDQLAIVTFDSQPRTLVGFDESGRLNEQQLRETAAAKLSELQPSWQPTDLGGALAYAADLAVQFEPSDQVVRDEAAASLIKDSAGNNAATMILVSDLQSGSDLDRLQSFNWPKGIRLDVQRVTAQTPTNASAKILSPSETAEEADSDPERIRVRVFNSGDSVTSQFKLAWADGAQMPDESTQMPVQVPPGESRIVRMPAPSPSQHALVLSGDDHDFDNIRYVVAAEPKTERLLYVGQPPEDPRNSLLYYLQRVPLDNRFRDVDVTSRSSESLVQPLDPQQTPLVVVSQPLSGESSSSSNPSSSNPSPSNITEQLRSYVSEGGKLLYVLAESSRLPDHQQSLSQLSGDAGLQIGEAAVENYAMFSQIDFSHPLFSPMADPQFNDFTKIRFWSHRNISDFDSQWAVPATFESPSDSQTQPPAILQRQLGEGTLWVLTAGWQPEQSQLALSTKFLPLIYGFYEFGKGPPVMLDQLVVGQPIGLPVSEQTVVVTPDGDKLELAASNAGQSSDAGQLVRETQAAREERATSEGQVIDEPGIYQWIQPNRTRSIAVNLDESESHTEPIDDDQLERFGVVLGSTVSQAQRLAEKRQLRDIELESRQKLWQWLLVAALALLGLETWLSGWLSKRSTAEPAVTMTA